LTQRAFSTSIQRHIAAFTAKVHYHYGYSFSKVGSFLASSSTSITYNSFLDSHPFRFLIGPSKKTFYVHAGLVAQQSSSLGALVSGPMTEAREKCAFLEDIDEDTFMRFIEYLYTDDYSVPEPEIVLRPSDIALEDGLDRTRETDSAIEPMTRPSGVTGQEQAELAVVEEDNWGFGLKKDKKKNKKTSKGNLWHEELEMLPESEPQPYHQDVFGFGEAQSGRECKKDRLWSAFKKKACVKHRASWEPRQNKESSEIYTPVFLCHAHLYVFSDRYGIELLQQLTLQKLRLTLSRFSLFKDRVPDIVELVKYVYKYTMDHDQGIDRMRSLVMDYVVCHLEVIAEDANLKQMLQEPGALAKDLLLKSMQRLD